MSKAVVVCSGGMDSVTLAHYVREDIVGDNGEVHGLGFNYGQRHKKELIFANMLVEDGILNSYTIVDTSILQPLLGASVLTDHDRTVPDGHYAEETMRATVVPNRNMIMLSIAIGYAVTLQAKYGVWTGVHGGDHYIYPDCRPPFIHSASEAAAFGNEGFLALYEGYDMINAPFLDRGKHDIAALGYQLGVDYKKTWSCYKGGDIHCGRCGTCVERKEAFRLSEVPDPTNYLDEEFEVVAYRG